ncbi:MAG: hypothetical protein LPH20_15625 [Shewanella sp.]|nr:hypothetical protein [Shewanella sp.]
MTGPHMRAALDECVDNNLDVLVYQRPDQSVMAVRCIPKADQVSKTIKARPYVPMKILRPVMKLDEVTD